MSELVRASLTLVVLVGGFMCGFCVATLAKRGAAARASGGASRWQHQRARSAEPATAPGRPTSVRERQPERMWPPVAGDGSRVGRRDSVGDNRGHEVLVQGLIGVYDVSGNAAVQAHVAQVLSRVGVQRVAVDPGAVFDPSVYEAVSTATTDDPDKVQRVIETIRPGWQRPDMVLRPPQVAVWVPGSVSRPPSGAARS